MRPLYATWDPLALYLSNPEGFREAFDALLEAAARLADQPSSEPPDELTATLAEFNSRYAVVNENGKTFVVSWQRDPSSAVKRSIVFLAALPDTA